MNSARLAMANSCRTQIRTDLLVICWGGAALGPCRLDIALPVLAGERMAATLTQGAHNSAEVTLLPGAHF
jgi:hypothetical protein